jgi:hypothetical protein
MNGDDGCAVARGSHTLVRPSSRSTLGASWARWARWARTSAIASCSPGMFGVAKVTRAISSPLARTSTGMPEASGAEEAQPLSQTSSARSGRAAPRGAGRKANTGVSSRHKRPRIGPDAGPCAQVPRANSLVAPAISAVL